MTHEITIVINTNCRVSQYIDAETSEELASRIKEAIRDCIALTPPEAVMTSRTAYLAQCIPAHTSANPDDPQSLKHITAGLTY